ncbi:MAG: hypothetical protein ACTHJ7_03000 [Candidatus Nitrosocosmicus sp.]
MISSSYAASTNTDLNNVFNCVTQKANERQNLSLSDAFVCYDHNLKGASKFASEPFQNPDLNNLGAKSTSGKSSDGSTTPDSISTKTNPKSSDTTADTSSKNKKGAAADTTTDNTNDPFAKVADTASKSKDKPGASPLSTTADPFAKGADTTSKSKTQPKEKADIDPSSNDFQSFDLPFSVVMPR